MQLLESFLIKVAEVGLVHCVSLTVRATQDLRQLSKRQRQSEAYRKAFVDDFGGLRGSWSSVDVDTRRTLDGWGFRVSASCGIFCLAKHVRTGPGANPPSYSVGAEIIFRC
jgi:hypothetical protein